MRSPSSRDAEPQKRRDVPWLPPKARTRMSMAVAALSMTAARSPETVMPSTNIRRPSTGSVSSKSISSRQRSSSGLWARTAWGTVTNANARRATAARDRNPLRGLLRALSRVSARWSRPLPFPPSFPLRLPNQRIRPLRRSF